MKQQQRDEPYLTYYLLKLYSNSTISIAITQLTTNYYYYTLTINVLTELTFTTYIAVTNSENYIFDAMLLEIG